MLHSVGSSVYPVVINIKCAVQHLPSCRQYELYAQWFSIQTVESSICPVIVNAHCGTQYKPSDYEYYYTRGIQYMPHDCQYWLWDPVYAQRLSILTMGFSSCPLFVNTNRWVQYMPSDCGAPSLSQRFHHQHRVCAPDHLHLHVRKFGAETSTGGCFYEIDDYFLPPGMPSPSINCKQLHWHTYLASRWAHSLVCLPVSQVMIDQEIMRRLVFSKKEMMVRVMLQVSYLSLQRFRLSWSFAHIASVPDRQRSVFCSSTYCLWCFNCMATA